MSKFKIKREIDINAPIEKVWDISYNKFSEVDKWLTAVPLSTGTNPSKEEDTTCKRQCTPNVKGFGKTLEALEYVDAKKKTLRYRILEGPPGFVKSATNTWTLKSAPGGTTLEMYTEMEVKGILGFLMGGLIKKQMPKIINEALEDLKHYAEHDQPRPLKVEASEKWARKNMKKAS